MRMVRVLIHTRGHIADEEQEDDQCAHLIVSRTYLSPELACFEGCEEESKDK